MIALLLALPLAAAAQEAAAPQLDARLLAGHPALSSGDADRLREDWMRALEAAPRSPLAGVAARLLQELGSQDAGARPLDPRRTAALLASQSDAEALYWLRHLHERALDRTRFSGERPADPADLWSGTVSRFLLLGPCDDGAEPAPLSRTEPWMPPAQFGPSLRDEARGLTRTWLPARREPCDSSFRPDESLFPREGTCFLLAFLRAEAGPARLEVRGEEDFLAWWNGARVLEALHPTLADRTHVQRAEVMLQRGWNAMLLRCDLSAGPSFAVRLLDAEGREVPFEEWSGDGWPEGLAPQRAGDVLPLPAPEPKHPGEGWERVLAAITARLDGRPDLALAMEPPAAADAELERAWLRARWAALRASWHLPPDVKRTRLLELERRLTELDGLTPEIALTAARRLLSEDRPSEALAAAEAALSRWPAAPQILLFRAEALGELDGRDFLRLEALANARALLPQHAGIALEHARLLSDAGLAAEARAGYVEAMNLGAGSRGLGQATGALYRGTEQDRRLADEWIGRALAERPMSSHYRDERLWALEQRGEDSALLAELRERARQKPHLPGSHESLGHALLELGRAEEAAVSYREALRLNPGDHGLREILHRLGRPADAAEDFFAAFAPDVAAALASAADPPAGGASTALLLDHAMVYVLPDGSHHTRTNVVRLAADRSGTEALHESPAGEVPRRARVVQPDGAVFEPHQVDGSWVFPELDPGDALDLEHDGKGWSWNGGLPDFGTWRFASDEEPFRLSRWVVYLPDGVPGEFRSFQFDGTHERLPWGGGTVHVFERRDSPRISPEVLQPSLDEIVPWAAYGADAPPDRAARRLREDLLRRLIPPADVAVELDHFLAAAALPAEPFVRAEALHAAVTEHLLEFTGMGDVTDAWTLRRGDALLLLSALWSRAGVEHEWAWTEEQAPELDPEPLRAFVPDDSYQAPALRLPPAAPGEEPTWVYADARGMPFGRLPPERMGARALVLERDGGWRHEELPRGALAETWDLDLEVLYRIGADAAAEASGAVRIPGAQGGALRQMVLDLEPEQRDQVARQILGQFAPGLDATSLEFVELERPGADFALSFAGTVPDFVRASGADFGARLRLPDLQLASGLGPAERSRKLAFRASLRVRTVVRLETGPERRLEYGPRSRLEERPGFRYLYDVALEERALRVERVLEMRGLEVEPGEFPEFLALLRELEQQEKRAARVLPAEAAAPR